MHEKLAKDLGMDTGYRRLHTLSVGISANKERQHRKRKLEVEIPDWIIPSHVTAGSRMGSPETTAQVHPKLFTEALLKRVLEKGCTLKKGIVENLIFEEGCEEKSGQKSIGKRIKGCTVDGQLVEADVVVIAMGPWSIQACKWLPNMPKISSCRAHSITMKPEKQVTPHALFLDYESPEGKVRYQLDLSF